MFRVKPAIFDLLLSVVIAGYLGLVYLLLGNGALVLSALASISRSIGLKNMIYYKNYSKKSSGHAPPPPKDLKETKM